MQDTNLKESLDLHFKIRKESNIVTIIKMIPQFLLHRELMNTADVSASQLQDVEPISKTYILLQLLFDFS